MCRFIPPLSSLAPHDSNLAVYAQVCCLLCVLYIPLFGLVQARPYGFNLLCGSHQLPVFLNTLYVCSCLSAICTYVRMFDILQPKLLALKRGVKVSQSPAFHDSKRCYDWLTVSEWR